MIRLSFYDGEGENSFDLSCPKDLQRLKDYELKCQLEEENKSWFTRMFLEL